MFRAGFTLFRRLTIACSLLVLLICGAEVAVRAYEALTGNCICPNTEGPCPDPTRLIVPSWSIYQELKPLSTAKVECRDSKTEVLLRTNSLGLRGAEPAIPKPAESYRIVVLGDETILAPETADQDHFCSLLQNQLQSASESKIEVINAGIPGHCPLTEFILFKQRLLALQPDMVLLHFDWSDVSDDRRVRRLARCDESGTPQSCAHTKLLSAKKKNSPQEICRQHFRLIDCLMSHLSVEWKQQLSRQKAASRDDNANPYVWLRDDHPEENLAFRQAVQPVVELAKTCRTSNISLVLMTSPKPWQVSAKCSRGEGVRTAAGVAREAYFPNRAPYDVLGKFAQRLRIPLLDGSIVLISGKEGETNFLRYAPRWSPAGHRRMAEFIARELAENMAGRRNHFGSPASEVPLTRTNSRDNEIRWINGTSSVQEQPIRPLPGLDRPQR